MRHTRPWPVVPSPVQRLPSAVEGKTVGSRDTPVANGVPVGSPAAGSGQVESSDAQPVASGTTFHTVPAPAESATYRIAATCRT